MEPKSKMFEKHYNDYLQRIACLDFNSISRKLGGKIHENQWGKSVKLTFFDKVYDISSKGIKDTSGKRPIYDICIILFRYLLMCPVTLPHDPQWVSFKDLKDAGPLTVYFRDNGEKAIAERFAGNTEKLKQYMAALNGYPPDLNVNYDLAIQIDALPKVPMLLLFNDADEGFPADCSILFERTVESYLDAECIAMLGYQLYVHLKPLILKFISPF
ncbi:DUF3786 domain-containing protein [Desulfobacula phenolica]|uniref:DUF3786 domain-containing protein n=1 Tax=Desulfobacula phenolica TaxID=90732 RepID=A0A1H2GLI6_9BACT|nr:DUF3786 domain-containing protein [Desulfobacula phenolica]SDU20425.1 protein of unknown function [Desulfobacula phenolica]